MLDFQYTNVDPATFVTRDMATIYVPDQKYSIGIQYEFLLANGSRLTPRLDYSHRSEIQTFRRPPTSGARGRHGSRCVELSDRVHAMSSIEASSIRENRRTFQPSFYFWMILVMCFLVFTGFGMTYWIPLAKGAFPAAPPIVHIHGLVFFAWMILLLVQSTLVNSGNVALHRSVGTLGIAHAAVVLYTGALIQLLGLRRVIAEGATGPFDTAYIALGAVIGFGFLFTLAIRNVRRPEAHTRLMLFAALPIIPPGVNRFYQVPFGLDYIPVLPLYLTLNSLAFAIGKFRR